MRGKIALEEHVSTPENNRLWDSTGEAGRNGTEYMKDVERRLLDRSIQLDTICAFFLQYSYQVQTHK